MTDVATETTPTRGLHVPGGRGRLVARWLLRRPLTLLGAATVLVVIVVGLAAPLLAPYDPLAINIGDRLQGLSRARPLGTDILHRWN